MTACRERGAALITILFVVCLCAVVVGAMLSRQRLDIRRTGNLQEHARLQGLLSGAEELARQTLAEDARAFPTVTYQGQDWSKMRPGVPVQGGILSVRIDDLQGLFNVNTLADTDADRDRFQLLLTTLKLPETLGNAMIPHLPLATIGELRALPGISAEDFAALAPFVTALPQRKSALNVNTAPDAVLRAYAQSPENFDRLIERRAVSGYLTEAQLNGIGMSTKGMTVRSDYFRLTATIQTGESTATLVSTLRRRVTPNGEANLHVVSRSFDGGSQ